MKRMLSIWSWSRRTTTVCLIATTAIALISAHLNNQEVLQARNSKQPCPGWHQHQQTQIFGNWTKQVQEAGMGTQPLPKPSTQEKAEQKGKLLKEKKQVTTGNPTITSRENRWIEKQERKLERNLLLMIASGTVCQARSHTCYSWCASLLTLTAMGV